jgi:tungstate transport system substrate-binding protein
MGQGMGQGMCATLKCAAAIKAYTLTDHATWVYFKNGQDLEIFSEVEPALFNSYGSILTNPAKWPKVKFADASIWHQWITTKPGLDAVLSYRINGEELFFPPRAQA